MEHKMHKKILILTRYVDKYPEIIDIMGTKYYTIVKDIPEADQSHCKGVLGICNEKLYSVIFDMPSRALSPDEVLYIWARINRTL